LRSFKLKAEAAECPEERNPWGRALHGKMRWSTAPFRRPGGADDTFAVVMNIRLQEKARQRQIRAKSLCYKGLSTGNAAEMGQI
jgi:hypothetical protein